MSSEKALGLTLRDEFGSRRQLLAGVRLWPKAVIHKRLLPANSGRSMLTRKASNKPRELKKFFPQ
ncbi:hypothetical protein RS3R6_30910 [Pseudomonas atacamensis]|uniref:Uncharacterized protein n=1 Tax=Pseudomonas atacamensis TaxID=2565368 RepID=A0ABQ5PQP9_9PSED|nr:hypothetical protein RS3R1_49620 [Pseudomonas atacamensis]GLH54909.1 hypothetical protein RS3R6_30910 [Pseudomonas atacamensis]